MTSHEPASPPNHETRFTPESDPDTDLDARPARTGGGRAARWIGLVALTLLAAFLVFEAAVAPRSATCEACHSDAAASALEAGHADVECGSCHTRGGASGWLEARASELTVMYPAMLTGERRTAAQVTSEVCVECHDDIQGLLTVDAISVRHETCVGEGAWCTDCHSTVGHGDSTRRVRYPTMDRCVGCHDGTVAPDDCDVCHSGQRDERRTDAGVWAVTHGPNWESTHGMGALDSCRVCHPAGYCSECHYDQPHPSDWPARHAAAATAEASIEESCLDCHVQSYCDSCHGLEMPHPPYWRPEHMDAADDMKDEACLVCHSAADCTTCHVAHTHPGRIDTGTRR